MPKSISIRINGRQFNVDQGTTVAVSMLAAGEACRSSVSGKPRAALCGMGICFECRVTIDGKAHCRGCQVQCEAGMEISTDE
jgi:D-hydroxyproline dehydrogenase subunit gamma